MRVIKERILKKIADQIQAIAKNSGKEDAFSLRGFYKPKKPMMKK